jgi:hypothetical protein
MGIEPPSFDKLRMTRSRLLPSNIRESFLLYGFLRFRVPTGTLESRRVLWNRLDGPLEEQPLRRQGRHGPTFASRNSIKWRRSQKLLAPRRRLGDAMSWDAPKLDLRRGKHGTQDLIFGLQRADLLGATRRFDVPVCCGSTLYEFT